MYSHINVQGRTSEKTFLYIYFRYFSFFFYCRHYQEIIEA